MSHFFFPFWKNNQKKTKPTFEELCQANKKQMFTVAFAILHNQEDAEDAVSDALLTMFKNFEKYESSSCQELEKLCVIISRNAAIDIYRQNQRNAGAIQHSDAAETADPYANVEESYFAEQDYRMLLLALQKLPHIYRDAMYLYYVEVRSTEEVMEILGISESAFRKRVERGKKELKRILEGGVDDA